MHQEKIRIGLVGVTGYTGIEFLRLIPNHPHMELVQVTSRQEAGKTLVELFPFLQNSSLADLIISDVNIYTLAKNCDLVFLAVPHGTAQQLVAALYERNVKVIDLSADFRLHDHNTYELWYKTGHSQTELLEQAVYGLPERYAEAISTAKLVANPGCYPTASILALAPALEYNFISTSGIVIDAKSGTSGAGRKASVGTAFCEVADSFKAYSVGEHRHTPEIEQELSIAAAMAVGATADTSLTLTFTPHLLPINRGILITAYAALASPIPTQEEVHTAYTQKYAGQPFIRVLPHGTVPELRNVRGTMYCDISVIIEARNNRLIILAAIDNLCRGASGQALANANLMCGLAMDTGLHLPPLVP